MIMGIYKAHISYINQNKISNRVFKNKAKILQAK